MKVHHLNCGSMCPIERRLINGTGGWLARAERCCHCLLIEGRQGLILVDTGPGVQDITQPKRLGLVFNLLTHPQLNLAETALHQIQALGFHAGNVRHIMVTHLDLENVSLICAHDPQGLAQHVRATSIDH